MSRTDAVGDETMVRSFDVFVGGEPRFALQFDQRPLVVLPFDAILGDMVKYVEDPELQLDALAPEAAGVVVQTENLVDDSLERNEAEGVSGVNLGLRTDREEGVVAGEEATAVALLVDNLAAVEGFVMKS